MCKTQVVHGRCFPVGVSGETDGHLAVLRPPATGGGTRPWATCTAGAPMGCRLHAWPHRRPHYNQGEVTHSVLSQADTVHGNDRSLWPRVAEPLPDSRIPERAADKGLRWLAPVCGCSSPPWGRSQGSSLPGDRTWQASPCGTSAGAKPPAWLDNDPWVARGTRFLPRGTGQAEGQCKPFDGV